MQKTARWGRAQLLEFLLSFQPTNLWQANLSVAGTGKLEMIKMYKNTSPHRVYILVRKYGQLKKKCVRAHTQMYVRKLHAGGPRGLWERVEQARGEGWGGMEVGCLPHRVLMRTKCVPACRSLGELNKCKLLLWAYITL